VVYLRDRTQWWSLIPAYVLIVIGLMVALIELGILTDLLIPGYIMFAIAIPFLAVFARDTDNWWALIPGGVLAFIGIVFFVAEAALQFILPAFLILIGLWILVRGFFRKDRGDREEPKGEAPGDDVTPK
jgi:predicted membrane protein